MNTIYLACYVAGLIRVPNRWVYALLAVALVASLSALTLAAGSEVAASSQQFSQEDVVQLDFESLTEANGSINPYAPFYGEGAMIGQTVMPVNQRPLNEGTSGACILPIYCW